MQGRQACAPLTVGIEDDGFIGLISVVGVEQPTQQTAPLVGVDHRAELATGAALLENAVEQRTDGAGHPGMKARILQKDRRKQG